MAVLKEIRESLAQLLFPKVCSGCGSDNLSEDNKLCIRCISNLPETNFEQHADNPVEKMFWGRLPLQAATAQYYFTKESLMQQLMHQFKYRGNRELGIQLGKLMGRQIKNSNRFQLCDALIPLPLFPNKERKRGYNQATLLCEGMATVLQIPVLTNAITRPQHTDTQTKKGRIERWKNMEGKFLLTNPELIKAKNILLVDDVITTGSTLEACGAELLKSNPAGLSVATLCMASK